MIIWGKKMEYWELQATCGIPGWIDLGTDSPTAVWWVSHYLSSQIKTQ